MKRSGPLPMLVGGVFIVGLLITLRVKGGWLIWLPVGMALLVFYHLGRTRSR
jgi:hypothetical protein